MIYLGLTMTVTLKIKLKNIIFCIIKNIYLKMK